MEEVRSELDSEGLMDEEEPPGKADLGLHNCSLCKACLPHREQGEGSPENLGGVRHVLQKPRACLSGVGFEVS